VIGSCERLERIDAPLACLTASAYCTPLLGSSQIWRCLPLDDRRSKYSRRRAAEATCCEVCDRSLAIAVLSVTAEVESLRQV